MTREEKILKERPKVWIARENEINASIDTFFEKFNYTVRAHGGGYLTGIRNDFRCMIDSYQFTPPISKKAELEILDCLFFNNEEV